MNRQQALYGDGFRRAKKDQDMGWLLKIWPFSCKGPRGTEGSCAVEKGVRTGRAQIPDYRERLACAETIITECRPQQVWLMILYVAAVRKEGEGKDVGPFDPKEMIGHLAMVEEILGKRHELKAEVESVKSRRGRVHARLHITAELFAYWLHNGTTAQEVSHVFSQMLEFDWLYPNSVSDIVESIPKGVLLEIERGQIKVKKGAKPIMEGLDRLSDQTSARYSATLKMYLKLWRAYKGSEGLKHLTTTVYKEISDTVIGMPTSDVAHTIFHFANGLDTDEEECCTDMLVFLSEAAAYYAASGTGGTDSTKWREIVRQAVPALPLVWTGEDSEPCHTYVMTVAVMLKLAEFQERKLVSAIDEGIVGLLRSLNRSDARPEDYKYLDNEWDRLNEMLKVITWTQV